jgi:segregation and condensation protein A
VGKFGSHAWIISYNPPAMVLNLSGQRTGEYTVAIPVFEGPLDILLQLIERTELDITVVALAQVTDQFLSYIKKMQVPADEISSFLVIAARLIQIKSEALLPRPPVRQPGEEDPGEELARQLRIYKRFKEVASWLEDRETRHLRTYLRVTSPPRLEGHLDMSGISLSDLADALQEAYASEREKASLGSVISAPRITIRQKIALITEYLNRNSNTSFKNLLGEDPNRLDMVVTFLALLELVKRYHVVARQDALFGEIQIEKMEGWQADEDLDLEFE